MFGLPVWLANILVSLITSVGLPLAEKLLPMIPSAVWAAIQDILNHFNSSATVELKQQHAEMLRQAVDGITHPK